MANNYCAMCHKFKDEKNTETTYKCAECDQKTANMCKACEEKFDPEDSGMIYCLNCHEDPTLTYGTCETCGMVIKQDEVDEFVLDFEILSCDVCARFNCKECNDKTLENVKKQGGGYNGPSPVLTCSECETTLCFDCCGGLMSANTGFDLTTEMCCSCFVMTKEKDEEEEEDDEEKEEENVENNKKRLNNADVVVDSSNSISKKKIKI